MSDDKQVYLRIDLFDESMNYGPASMEIPLPEGVEAESFAKGAYAAVEAIFKYYGVEEVQGKIDPTIPRKPEDDG